MSEKIIIRNAHIQDYDEVGALMVEVYSSLNNFPGPDEQPGYYNLLKHIGKWCEKPNTSLLVAIDNKHKICGAVVYFSDMKAYGAGGKATTEQEGSGFRLLAVANSERGKGIGSKLSMYCIDLARQAQHKTVIIHSTEAMRIAWKMYEKIGFERFEEIDFVQDGLEVFGFRLLIK